MPWIPITAETVANRLAAAEFAALTTAAKSVSQTSESILAAAVASVTAEVRGYVAACRHNVLGPAGTIPEELESAALALVRRHLASRLPVKALFDELRQKEAEDALTRLRDTAACKFAIVPPETPAPENQQASGPSVQLINSRERQATRERMNGL